MLMDLLGQANSEKNVTTMEGAFTSFFGYECGFCCCISTKQKLSPSSSSSSSSTIRPKNVFHKILVL
jgi:hypothetical protein